MTEQGDSLRLRAEEAYSKLMYELYTNGPIRLISDNGHVDLVNEQVRLCCMREPFLDVIDAMQKRQLVEKIGDREQARMYALTEKGFLTALVMRSRRRADDLCECANCGDAFEEILRQLRDNGELQLVLGHNGHPHFVGNAIQLCCDQKPFLDAICRLERYNLVFMTDDLSYRLTRRGAITAQMMLLPGSKNFSKRAFLN